MSERSLWSDDDGHRWISSRPSADAAPPADVTRPVDVTPPPDAAPRTDARPRRASSAADEPASAWSRIGVQLAVAGVAGAAVGALTQVLR